ncbi:hypothetical protein M436DRAFT_81380 [Aureobasidium namibiae CBS 147.97]|uniref:Uncharacterized protein n=1 Tax=Aureobasidium namibiae CBS 147.97 TaxID=1043004 RepID=A0A074WW40_9PEZI
MTVKETAEDLSMAWEHKFHHRHDTTASPALWCVTSLQLNKMSQQRNQHYHAIPHARASYDHLCKKHRTIPTPADVDAITRIIGSVSSQALIRACFEPGLLFFLERSAVRFQSGSLLIGWVYAFEGHDRVEKEVWFKPPIPGESSLCHVPEAYDASMYSPKGRSIICDKWHPVIFDIVSPNENKGRTLQNTFFRACIKLLEADVPPPSVERSGSTLSASTNSITFNPNGPHRKRTTTPGATPAPSGSETSVTVDLTGSDEEVVIKTEVPTIATAIKQIQTHRSQVEDKIQAFRDKLDKKEVEELEQMLEKELPSWIKKLAEDVLQKKMLKELELAESFLL